MLSTPIWSVHVFLLVATIVPAVGFAQTYPNVAKDAAEVESEKAALLEVIERQSAAFWAKDFQRWADTWVHADYVRRVGWSQPAGASNIEGWDAIGAAMRKNMSDNPKPNLTPAKLSRTHFNFRIYGNVAWVTFQQRGVDTGEPRFDMPGLSFETRMFEKHDGKWKIVYLGYVLEEYRETPSGR
jgi:hypothetical protein